MRVIKWPYVQDGKEVVAISLSEIDARKLYATLSLVTQQPDNIIPMENKVQALKLIDKINKVFM